MCCQGRFPVSYVGKGVRSGEPFKQWVNRGQLTNTVGRGKAGRLFECPKTYKYSTDRHSATFTNGDYSLQ